MMYHSDARTNGTQMVIWCGLLSHTIFLAGNSFTALPVLLNAVNECSNVQNILNFTSNIGDKRAQITLVALAFVALVAI